MYICIERISKDLPIISDELNQLSLIFKDIFMNKTFTLISAAVMCASTASAQLGSEPVVTFHNESSLSFIPQDYTAGQDGKLYYAIDDDNQQFVIVNGDFQKEKTIKVNASPITFTTKFYTKLQNVTVSVLSIRSNVEYEGADGGKMVIGAVDTYQQGSWFDLTPDEALATMKDRFGNDIIQEKKGNDIYYYVNGAFYESDKYGTKYPTQYGRLTMTTATKGNFAIYGAQYGDCPTYTEEGATKMFKNRGYEPTKVDDCLYFYPNADYNNDEYFMYGRFKTTYPKRYYVLDGDGIVRYYSVDYNVQADRGETWIPENTESETHIPEVEEIELISAKFGGVDTYDFEISQTLFNTNASYEYVLPIIGTYDEVSYDTRYLDGFGSYEVKVEGQHIYDAGYKVVDENGKELSRIMLPAGYRGSNVQVVDFGPKRYFVVEAYNSIKVDYWGDMSMFVYSINPSGSGVMELVMEESGVKVSPRVARRSTPINVTLSSEGKSDRQVIVTSVNGVTVMTKNVSAGETSTSIDTSRMQQGMYVVSVVENGKKSEHCKVVIR